MIKKILKNIWYWFQRLDFIWSIPLAIFLYIQMAVFGTMIFGQGFAPYPPEFIHAAIYSTLFMTFANGVVQIGLFFNFKTVYRYIYNGGRDDFKNLPKWQKLAITLFLYVFYFVSFLFIWSRLV